jgi:hypothetical protein
MTINNDVTGGVRNVPGRETPTPASIDKKPAEAPSPAAARTDGVDVSAEGRALARGSGLSRERIASIRERILRGAYDQAGVIESVARRILQSGDL